MTKQYLVWIKGAMPLLFSGFYSSTNDNGYPWVNSIDHAQRFNTLEEAQEITKFTNHPENCTILEIIS